MVLAWGQLEFYRLGTPARVVLRAAYLHEVPSAPYRYGGSRAGFPTVREGLQIATTFCMVLVAWIFFRAASLDEALRFIVHMCTHDWLVYPEYKSGAV